MKISDFFETLTFKIRHSLFDIVDYQYEELTHINKNLL